MADIEIRNFARIVELRKSDNGPGTLEGYAAVFNRLSQNLGGFVEQVDPVAFNKSLADGVSVVARYNHSDNYLLGTTEAETLRLSADNMGLLYSVDLPDTTAGRDVAALAVRGDLRYSSFAFMTMEDDWGVTEQGFPLRTLRSVQLVDVAPVNSPAYRDTTAGVRSLARRLSVDVEVVQKATTEELRSMIQGGSVPNRVDDDRHVAALAARLAQLQRFVPAAPTLDLRADMSAADAKYLRDMIVHHEAAVTMSKKYLSVAKSKRRDDVTKMAEGVISAQTDEIAQMKKWLADDGKSSGGGMKM